MVFHHAAFTTAFELRGVRIPFTHHVALVGRYFAHMDIGVEIFFLISGFLLYRPMVAAAFAGRHPRADAPLVLLGPEKGRRAFSAWGSVKHLRKAFAVRWPDSCS